MKLSYIASAALAVMVIASAPASAAVFVLGNVTPTGGVAVSKQTTDTYTTTGTYTSYYQFTLSANTVMSFASYTDAGSAALYGFDAAKAYNGTCDGTVASPCTGAFVGSGATSTQNGNESFGMSRIMNAGSYTIAVTGNVQSLPGALQGNFRFQSAVPEAATWAMMVLGFGAVGGALRSNRRKVIFA